MHRFRIFGHAVFAQFILLFLFEGMANIGAVYLAALARFPALDLAGIQATIGPVMPRALLFALVVSLSMVSLANYSISQLRRNLVQQLPRLAIAYLIALLVLALIFYLIPAVHVGRGMFGMALLFSLLFLVAGRLVFARLVYDQFLWRKILVLGSGEKALELRRYTANGVVPRFYTIAGYVHLDEDTTQISPGEIASLDESLHEYVKHNAIDVIIVAADDRRSKLPLGELLECRLAGVRIMDLESFYESEQKKIRTDIVTPGWLVFSEGFNRNLLNTVGERILDTTLSLVALAVTAPIAIITALAIKLEGGWRAPVLFNQTRVGAGGRHFTIHKFRSMRIDAEESGEAVWAALDDERVTRVGSVLRKYRIDEIPQLINVLRGEMSLVGPRPERPEFIEELARKIPYFTERHRIRPGITGWAQIKYPYGASTRDAMEKLQYDLYYIKYHSVFLYLLVILLTVEVIVFNKGAR